MSEKRSPIQAIDYEQHATLAAPYRARLANGQLGPEYLPISPRTGTAGTWERCKRESGQSFHVVPVGGIGSGGFWDWTEEDSMQEEPTKRERDDSQRKDSDRLAHYMERHSLDVPGRELEAYILFYEQRRSYGKVARIMGVAVSTVREWVNRLRARPLKCKCRELHA